MSVVILNLKTNVVWHIIDKYECINKQQLDSEINNVARKLVMAKKTCSWLIPIKNYVALDPVFKQT